MKEKNKIAVALSYDSNQDIAPKIIASGRGHLADKIKQASQEAKIPIHQDIPLANSLSKLELGDTIPKELYGAVAEILAYVDRMDQRKKQQ